MSRASRRILIALVVLGGFYSFGGLDAIRWARARWRASLQPPTPDQLRVATDTVVPLRASLPATAVRGKMWLSDPPRPVTIGVVLAAILAGAVIAMFITGREQNVQAAATVRTQRLGE
jgi:hypothetical protein